MPVTKPPSDAFLDVSYANYAHLVLACLMADGTGTTVTDYSPSPQNGTLTHGSSGAIPTWVTGHFGGPALAFDGVGSFVTFGNPSKLNLTKLTIVAWVNFSVATTLSIAGDMNSDATQMNNWFYTTSSSGELLNVEWGGSVVGQAGSSFPTGGWHQVAFVRGGTTGAWTWAIYIDGVLSASGSTAANPGTQQTFSAGRPGAFDGFYLNGLFDNLLVFNIDLGATDIANLNTNPFLPYKAITFTPSTLPNGDKASAYPTETFVASGGTGPYSYATSAGTLPTGLALTTSGVLAGTPTAFGTFTFTITATDSTAHTGNQAYTVTINPTLAIAGPVILPNGMLGVPYNVTLTAVGGSG